MTDNEKDAIEVVEVDGLFLTKEAAAKYVRDGSIASSAVDSCGGGSTERSGPPTFSAANLLDFLKRTAVGRDRGRRGKDLASRFRVHNRMIGSAVADLVADGAPIGADPSAGYYILETREEYEKADREIASRIEALSKRRKALRLTGRARFGDFYTLPLFPLDGGGAAE